MNDIILAYAAGLFDGEGCVGIQKNRKKTGMRNFHYELVISVNMTSREIIRWLQQHFGGNIYPYKSLKPNHKEQWDWSLCSQSALKFLTLIKPYLILKKPHAEIASEFQQGILPRNNTPLSPSEVARREACYQVMAKLNS